MPRFFFDFDDGETRDTDSDGTEFPDFERACEGAAQALPNIAAEVKPRCEGTREFAVTVRDEAGQPVYRAALTITGRRIAGEDAEG